MNVWLTLVWKCNGHSRTSLAPAMDLSSRDKNILYGCALGGGNGGMGLKVKNNQIFLLAKTRRSSLEIGNSDIHYLVHSCVLTQWSKHRMCYMRDSSHDVI